MNRTLPSRQPAVQRSSARRIVFAAWLAISVSCAANQRVVILGIDGMDPNLLKKFMNAGVMPNFKKLATEGDFKPLQTTMAPQSPVAWSTFITGMDPGGHGIYDFIHRDPKSFTPFSSMSRASPPKSLQWRTWVLPLSGGKVELLRKGKAFWQVLGDAGYTSTIFRMPVNFPPVDAPGLQLSGMGTPDILGTPGTFSYYTNRLPADYRTYTGGNAYPVKVEQNVVRAKLHGPDNAFRRNATTSPAGGSEKTTVYEPAPTSVDFTVYIDNEAGAAKFEVGDQEFILKEKEWSDWVDITFENIPGLITVESMGRFYLKQLKPDFQLYVSPLQIHPASPSMPISNPSGWSKTLCSCVGYFYTQELPADTKAFTHGVFSGQEFWDQLMIAHGERSRALDYILESDTSDLLFFYFMAVDQGSHMLWHYMDKNHPGHVADAFMETRIQTLYRNMDDVLGRVTASIDSETTLIVMSDHGFSPFYWGVNLNSWLADNGFTRLFSQYQRGKSQDDFWRLVDWSGTKAYALGLNGVYVNLKGREKNGIVEPGAAYDQVLDRLEAELLAMTDPRNGRHPVSKVTRPSRDFSGPHKDDGPDLIIGYSQGYRSSWENPLGSFPIETFPVNTDAWSGDHCIDNRLVPGVLLTNKKITLDSPALYDLTVAILDEFKLAPLSQMIGKDCLGE